LVIGKTSAAAANLVEQFQARKTSKEYLAIVRGVMKDDTVQIDVPIGRHPQSEIRVKMHAVVVGADGKPLYLPESETFSAKTQVEVIERKQRFTLVKCKPHTGRQHQIRVHLDYVGHPIAGDKLYGQPDNVFLENIRERAEVEVEHGISLARHALHAHKLSLTHPVTHKTMEFKTELPEELKMFWDKLD
jgi:23S rRNA pseudouridine1911/1915/1917 synthase